MAEGRTVKDVETTHEGLSIAVAAYAARTLTLSFPWAYAHGYLLPRLRRSTGTRAGARGLII